MSPWKSGGPRPTAAGTSCPASSPLRRFCVSPYTAPLQRRLGLFGTCLHPPPASVQPDDEAADCATAICFLLVSTRDEVLQQIGVHVSAKVAEQSAITTLGHP